MEPAYGGDAARSAPVRFEVAVRIDDGDVDDLGHVNNVVYLRWVQDAAAAHWRDASTDEERAAIAWVAVRHEIDYKAPAFPGDDVLATTWVEAWSAVTSERHTEVRRVADDAVLARAKTVWCSVDPATQRPRRVPEEVKARFSR